MLFELMLIAIFLLILNISCVQLLIFQKMGGMTQRPWTPTRRRGPIAAEFSGPGPACVALQSSIGNF